MNRRQNLQLAALLLILFSCVAGCYAITDPSSSSSTASTTTTTKTSIPRSTERNLHHGSSETYRYPPWNPSPHIDAHGFLIPQYHRVPGEWEWVGRKLLIRNNARQMQQVSPKHSLAEAPPVIIRQVPGDGNCLFHSISTSYAHAINGTHIDLRNADTMKWLYQHSAKLRQLAVDCLEGKRRVGSSSSSISAPPSSATKSKQQQQLLFLQGNDYLKCRDLVEAAAAQYGISGDEYCHLMRQDSYWGGGPEIVALCNVLQRPIHVYELHVPKNKKPKKKKSKYLFGNTKSMSGDAAPNENDNDNNNNTDQVSSSFVLRRMACFGSPKFDKRGPPLHILSADSRFPDISPGKQLPSGNHFLAIFPHEKKDTMEQKSSQKQRIRGGANGMNEYDDDEYYTEEGDEDSMGWWGRFWRFW